MIDSPWDKYVLFDGNRYAAFNLPRSYLPRVVIIQISEPLVILAGTGIMVSLVAVLSNRYKVYKLQIYFLFWRSYTFCGNQALEKVIGWGNLIVL